MNAPLWWLGTLGLVAIEASYVPQIVRLWRRKQAQDVSLLFPALNLAGRLAVVAYALARDESVFVWGFVVGSLLRATLLGQVLLYRWGDAPARRGVEWEIAPATLPVRSGT